MKRCRRLHQRLSCPTQERGAMTIYQADARDHIAISKHVTAEEGVEEFIAGKGIVVKWERLRRQNHWFDALYMACAAGSFCGVRMFNERGELRAAARVVRGSSPADRRTRGRSPDLASGGVAAHRRACRHLSKQS